MTSFNDLFNPATTIGSIFINIAGGIGVVIVLGFFAWLGGLLRWWVIERGLRLILLNGRSFVFVFNPTHGQEKVITFLPNGEIGKGKNSNEHTW